MRHTLTRYAFQLGFAGFHVLKNNFLAEFMYIRF